MNAVVEHEEAPQHGRQLAPYESAIAKSKDRFTSIAGDLVSYDKESIFAMQALMKTDFAMQTANKNPQSVRLAMINVAATGLTLNPVYGYAYLVPRDGAIVLDIGYKGLLKIATDIGSIMWGKADLVYEKDSFIYHGPAKAPDHSGQPFMDRGAFIGCYCIAKTRDGDTLTEVMTLEDIEKVRGKSELFKRKGSGPWVEFFGEMVKKACIKRASKTWPKTKHSGRLLEAIELASSSEGGYSFDAPQEPVTMQRITPRGGVYEALDEADQKIVSESAIIVREYFDADDLPGALEYIDRLGFDADKRVAMEGLLTSAMRSALKTGFATRKKMEKQA